jgi:hypothetical protein
MCAQKSIAASAGVGVEGNGHERAEQNLAMRPIQKGSRSALSRSKEEEYGGGEK